LTGAAIRTYLGVDLSALPRKNSYACAAQFSPTPRKFAGAEFFAVKGDDELLRVVELVRPIHVVIDAPLSLPEKDEMGFRPQDRCAIEMGGRMLPLDFKGMRELALRGERLAATLTELGFSVLETHPFSAARVLGYASTIELARDLLGKGVSKGRADSLICGLVGYLWDAGLAVSCGGKPPLLLPLRGVLRVAELRR